MWAAVNNISYNNLVDQDFLLQTRIYIKPREGPLCPLFLVLMSFTGGTREHEALRTERNVRENASGCEKTRHMVPGSAQTSLYHFPK